MMTDIHFLQDFPPGPLDKYRKNASFSWKKMKLLVEGEELIKYKMKFFRNMEEDIIFRTHPQNLDEYRRITCLRMLKIKEWDLLTVPDLLEEKKKLNTFSAAIVQTCPSTGVKLTVTFGMFQMALLGLGTKRHYQYFNKAAKKYPEIYGCFAMTEIGHGTNIKGLRTVAKYIPETEEFELNTPDFEAAKCWIGNLGKTCTHAVVFAKLITPDKKNHGLHGFIVPIRSTKTLEPFSGIIVGDMGEKIGMNGVDNGFLMFNKYRIPRVNLLNRTGDVLPDGTYTSPFKDPMKKFGMSLGALSLTRSIVMNNCIALTIKTITIGIRYIAARKLIDDSGEEVALIELQSEQYRLFPYLAAAYASRVFVDFTIELFIDYQMKLITEDSVEVDQGPEVHALLSAGKPYTSWLTRDVIKECREACREHAFMKVCCFGQLINELDPICTFEGVNGVLMQQTSNLLLGMLKSIKRNPNFRSPLQSVDFLSNIEEILSCTFPDHAPTTPQSLLASFRWLISFLLVHTNQKMEEDFKLGKNKFMVKNDSQVYYAHELSKAYMEHYILKTFLEFIESKCTEPDERSVLITLARLYGTWSLEKYIPFLYQGGYMKKGSSSTILQDELLNLCSELKQNAVSLVDAIAPPDFIIESPLGQSDGEIYKNLERAIFQNRNTFQHPSWWNEPMDLDCKAKL